MKKEGQILIFGASVAYGAWDELGGWADRLKQRAHKLVLEDPKKYIVVFNLGIDFGSTESLLERLENEYQARKYREGKNEVDRTIVFSVGGNDALYYNEEQKHKVEIGAYGENLRQLFNKAKELGVDRIICLSGTPYDESKTNPVPWMPEASYRNGYLEKYDAVKKELCVEMGVTYIDIYNPFKEQNYKNLLSDDGVHPNSEGHELIFNVIKDIVLKD